MNPEVYIVVVWLNGPKVDATVKWGHPKDYTKTIGPVEGKELEWSIGERLVMCRGSVRVMLHKQLALDYFVICILAIR